MTSRTTKTIYNLYASIGYQIIIAILSFIVRKVFLDHISVDYLGLDGLFTNLINMICLCDLGIGTASVYYFYKAAASDNESDLILTYQALTYLYRLISVVLTVLGVFICINLTKFVDLNGYNLNYIRLIFIIIFSRTICHFLMSCPKVLLQCNQQNYYNMIANAIVSIIFIFIKLFIIIYTENYVIYAIVILFENIINYLAIYIKFKKLFPKKYIFAKPVFQNKVLELLNYGKKLVITNINVFIFNSTDYIVITKFLGLATAGIMNNYYMIVNSIQLFAIQILEAASASISNYLNDEKVNQAKNINHLLDIMGFICLVIGLPASVALFGLTNEFINLYFGNHFVLSKWIIVLFSINLIVILIQTTLGTYTTAKGLVAHETKYAIMMSIVNLAISVIGAQYLGVSGVLLGTLISNFIMIIGRLKILEAKIAINFSFHFKNFLCYILITIVLMGFIQIFFPSECSTFIAWIIRAIFCIILSLFPILLFYRTQKFKTVLDMIYKIIHIFTFTI